MILSVQAIHDRAAIGTIAARRQIAVAGKDRASFLQGLLTNDIPALTPGTGCYAAWLTAQGRMLTDLHVLESGTMILLDVPEAQADATLERLDQFLFSEDVQLQSLAGVLIGVWIHGPESPAVLEKVLRFSAEAADVALAQWSEYQHTQAQFGEQPVVVARISQLGVPGFCVYLNPAHEAALLDALHIGGAITVPPEALEAARVEAGYPLFGIDMTEDTIPLEAGIEQQAISFTKGCYVGQEIVIRVLHRGGGRVARRLVGLKIAGAVPPRGAAIFAGDKQIGAITSSADSPRLGAIAMGYVHRDFTAADTAVQVDVNGQRSAATVTSRPIA